MERGKRVVRALGLLAAVAAAGAVFFLGDPDGGSDWRLPGLALVAVLVLILHVATAPTRTEVVVEYVGPPAGAAGALGLTTLSPVVADAVAAAPAGGAPAAPTVVVPDFPDAGHDHGPIRPLAAGLPPVGAVTGAPPPVPVAPAGARTEPSSPAVDPRSDAVLVNLRPDDPDPMVMRLLESPPPPAAPPPTTPPATAPPPTPPPPTRPPTAPPPTTAPPPADGPSPWQPPADWAPPAPPGRPTPPGGPTP